MTVAQLTNGTKSNGARRRRVVHPEQVALIIERPETVHLTISIENAQGLTQLLNGLENRLSVVEDNATDGLAAARAELARQLAERARNVNPNGHDSNHAA